MIEDMFAHESWEPPDPELRKLRKDFYGPLTDQLVRHHMAEGQAEEDAKSHEQQERAARVHERWTKAKILAKDVGHSLHTMHDMALERWFLQWQHKAVTLYPPPILVHDGDKNLDADVMAVGDSDYEDSDDDPDEVPEEDPSATAADDDAAEDDIPEALSSAHSAAHSAAPSRRGSMRDAASVPGSVPGSKPGSRPVSRGVRISDTVDVDDGSQAGSQAGSKVGSKAGSRVESRVESRAESRVESRVESRAESRAGSKPGTPKPGTAAGSRPSTASAPGTVRSSR